MQTQKFLRPGEGDAVWFLDNFLTVKASGRDGAGFALLECVLPAGSHTPYHRHQDDDETMYLIEGRMSFFVEGQALEAVPGTFVHLPRGTAHGFRTETPVKMLVLCGPAGFVEFARDVGMDAPRRELPPPAEPDTPRMMAMAEKHRIDILGPLPAA